MDKSRDLRRNSMSTVNGVPRRRQRVTTLRESTDEDRQMELMEAVRFRDREQSQKKDRDREFAKRRRVDREDMSTDSSDEEYFEEEEGTKIHHRNRTSQHSPPASSSLTNKSRGGLRTLRSAPALRAAVDEVIGVPIPRRARSASARKLHEYRNSVSGGFSEDSSRRKFPPATATASMIGSGGASPSSPGSSMKKKMKYVEPRTRALSSASGSKPFSVNQDDIEIEVAEALFDLMKQSHSQSESQSSEREEKVDRDSTNTDDDQLKSLKAERGKDEIDTSKVQSEQSIKVNAEIILADSIKEVKKGGRIEIEEFADDPVHELVRGDEFVDKGKVGSPKQSESPSCVKVNACDIQDPTVTKAIDVASVVATKKVARMEIDLMALPSLPSSPERDAVLDIDLKVTTRDVEKKIETTSKNDSVAEGNRIQEEKIGVNDSSNQLLNHSLVKNRHEISSVNDGTIRQQEGRREQKNRSAPTSVMPFSIGTSSKPGVVSHPGYTPSQQAVLPIDRSARSPMKTQPRRKRCATHKYISQMILHHQKLINDSLSSGPNGAAKLFGSKSLSLKSMLPTQSFNPGKDKHSDVPAADFNATKNSKPVLQQASNQAPAPNFLHGNPGFIFPFGHHQTTMMAPVVSSGPPHSTSSVSTNASLPSNTSRKIPANSTMPSPSTSVTFNHPMLPSDETAQYMALLQNSGCPFPIPTNIALPSFKGGLSTTASFLNSSFYSTPVFNVAQNQHMLSLPHAPVQSTSQKIGENKLPASINADLKQPDKNNPSVVDNLVSHSVKPNNNNSQSCSNSVQPMNFGNKQGDLSRPFPAPPVLNFSSMAQNSAIFQMFPEMSWNGNKNYPTPEGKSSNHKPDSASAPSKFDSLGLNISFLPPALVPNFYNQMQIKGTTQPMSSPPNNHVFGRASVQTDYSFFPKWDSFPRNTSAEGSSSSQSATPKNHITLVNGVINNQPVSSLVVGSSSNSPISKNTSTSQRKIPALATSQETEASQNGPGQKSSPACRRNVPSILNTCPSQLPELKYR